MNKAKKKYRVKARVWVLRWHNIPSGDPATDYVGMLNLTSKAWAREFRSVAAAKATVAKLGLDWECWRIVRRGPVAK